MFLSFLRWKQYSLEQDRCIICLKSNSLVSLPCSICKDKYIHNQCLRSYLRFNNGEDECFVCRAGTLSLNDEPERNTSYEIDYPTSFRVSRYINCHNLIRGFYCLLVSGLFFILGSIIGALCVVAFFGRSENEIYQGDWMFFLISGIISIFLWASISIKRNANICCLQ